MKLIVSATALAVVAIASLPSLAQSVDIPGVGSIPIRGKLGKLLGNGKPHAASAPSDSSQGSASRPNEGAAHYEEDDRHLYCHKIYQTGEQPLCAGSTASAPQGPYPQHNGVGATARWTSDVDIESFRRYPKFPYPATHEEALRCTALLDIGYVARNRYRQDERIAGFPQPTKDDRARLWALIINTNEEIRQLPDDEAVRKMHQVRNRYTNRAVGRYLSDAEMLVRHYQDCQNKKMLRR